MAERCEEGISPLRTRVAGACEPPRGCWELSPGPEQQVPPGAGWLSGPIFFFTFSDCCTWLFSHFPGLKTKKLIKIYFTDVPVFHVRASHYTADLKCLLPASRDR